MSVSSQDEAARAGHGRARPVAWGCAVLGWVLTWVFVLSLLDVASWFAFVLGPLAGHGLACAWCAWMSRRIGASPAWGAYVFATIISAVTAVAGFVVFVLPGMAGAMVGGCCAR